MNLSTYIDTTITEVFKGIKSAAEKAKEYGASVNPVAEGHVYSRNAATKSYEINDLIMLEFEVGLVVRNDAAGEAGGTISVFGIGGSGKGSVGTSSEQTNRISFSIPLQLPAGEKLAVYSRTAKLGLKK